MPSIQQRRGHGFAHKLHAAKRRQTLQELPLAITHIPHMGWSQTAESGETLALPEPQPRPRDSCHSIKNVHLHLWVKQDADTHNRYDQDTFHNYLTLTEANHLSLHRNRQLPGTGATTQQSETAMQDFNHSLNSAPPSWGWGRTVWSSTQWAHLLTWGFASNNNTLQKITSTSEMNGNNVNKEKNTWRNR